MKPSVPTKLFTLAFGLFLGLGLWKFGNPVILDHKISAPVTGVEFFYQAWPLHWANWVFLPLAALGALLIFANPPAWPRLKWLGLWPLVWLGWQFVAATQTVDADLTRATLWQFAGCAAAYFLGALFFARGRLWRWLLPGLLAAFGFCLIRGIDQRVYEFPQNYQMLVQGERAGWTNFPPESIAQMKTEQIIITTNGAEMANPVILEKFKKGRVAGPLVYPNALAGLILLLWPLSLTLALGATKTLRPLIRLAAIALTIFLGGAAFFWTGSKLGWLLGIALAGLFLLRRDWPVKLKRVAVALVLIVGLGIFAVRFHSYFAAGATSVGARLDYWRAAVQTTLARPVFGTGPGTFQRPYAQLKAPTAEMARLTHNDYLEQFSDSGLVGGLAYSAWILLALLTAGRRIWRANDALAFALLAGLLGWFAQGFGEFGLYIPGLAWPAFTLLGCLVGWCLPESPPARSGTGG
jgi:O-antigen ligase